MGSAVVGFVPNAVSWMYPLPCAEQMICPSRNAAYWVEVAELPIPTTMLLMGVTPVTYAVAVYGAEDPFHAEADTDTVDPLAWIAEIFPRAIAFCADVSDWETSVDTKPMFSADCDFCASVSVCAL